jgi:transposase, IS5 family
MPKPKWWCCILKQLDNLSDEQVVLNSKRNPYYQAFCGLTEFSNKPTCDSTELIHFRKRIGTEGVDHLFQLSVRLHSKAALENTVNIDTTHPTSGVVSRCHVVFFNFTQSVCHYR